jgi:WD40 repeat protein
MVTFGPRNKTVATSPARGRTEIWDISTGELVTTIQSYSDYETRHFAFSPDGKNIITSTIMFGQVIKWDAATGERISIIHEAGKGENRTKYGTFNDYSPDGKFLFGYDYDKKIAKIWDAATGKLLHTLRGHQYTINHIACSPNSKYIITTALNGSLILWDAATGAKVLKQYIYDDFERVTTANGLFDATSGAKDKVYSVRDAGIAGYEQLKNEGYEEPNLWSKIMKGEKLRELVQ